MDKVFVVMERAIRDDSEFATETPWRFDRREEADAEAKRLNGAKPDTHPGYFVEEKSK